MSLPEYVTQGERARLFPVLSTTSKEGRTTSIFLSCLSSVDEFGTELLGSIGVKLGKRSKLTCYTEVVLRHAKDAKNDRPDGLLIVTNGSREWRALIETKVASSKLTSEQIEKYRKIAKEHHIDAIITISNEFASLPSNHPLPEIRKSKSKIPVFHWSWMFILTQADLLLAGDGVEDEDQLFILQELRRFLLHESAGVKGFERMPSEWPELNRLVSAGGKIPARSPEADATVAAWFQETKDLSLILSRQVETSVSEKMKRSFLSDVGAREKEALETLRSQCCLKAEFDIPNAAAPLTVCADLLRRAVDVGMALRAPTDKKSSKARVNWLLRQISSENTADLHIRMQWPGRSEDTQFSFVELSADPAICEVDKQGLQVASFFIFNASKLGARFTQQSNFISDIETLVPQFYRDIGQSLSEWRAAAPKIKKDRETAHDVSVESMEDDVEGELGA